VVESWHSMARAILIYMSYVKDVVRVSIMIKSLVANMDTQQNQKEIISRRMSMLSVRTQIQ
jgi:hypothetical protein